MDMYDLSASINENEFYDADESLFMGQKYILISFLLHIADLFVRHLNEGSAVLRSSIFSLVNDIQMNMKIRYNFVAVLLLILASIISSNAFAQGFEGVVTMQMSMPLLGDQKIPMTINVKGDKTMTVMDIPMQGSMKIYADKTTK